MDDARPMLACPGDLAERAGRLVCSRGLACLVEELMRRQGEAWSPRLSGDIRRSHA